MKHRIRFLALFTCLFLGNLAASPLVRADEPEHGPEGGNKAIRELCDQGIEGIYHGQLEGVQGARLTLICIEHDRIISSLALHSPQATPNAPDFINSYAFSIAAVDDGELVLSTFKLDSKERREVSSKTMAAYMRIDPAALRDHRIQGSFVSTNSFDFRRLDLKLAQSLPTPQGAAAGTWTKAVVRGSYSIPKSPFGSLRLLVDVLSDTPLYNLVLEGEVGVHLYDAPAWDGTGLISASTPQGDGEEDQHKLMYLRGRVVNDHELELWFINNRTGVAGPYRAIRRHAGSPDAAPNRAEFRAPVIPRPLN